jgi:hypothetical protein
MEKYQWALICEFGREMPVEPEVRALAELRRGRGFDLYVCRHESLRLER